MKELSMTVWHEKPQTIQTSEPVPTYELSIDGLETTEEAEGRPTRLSLLFYFLVPKVRKQKGKGDIDCLLNIKFSAAEKEPLDRSAKEIRAVLALYSQVKPLTELFKTYSPTEQERKTLMAAYDPVNPERAYAHIGKFVKKILEGAGYKVRLEVLAPYFPSPTSMALVSPVFSLGLRKEIEPIEAKEGYETTFIYLSHEKPQSKTQIQLKIFDTIPEERLRELQRSFKDNLSPYGLKCLYLTIKECSYNKRNPWFVLDANRCLDRMGYKKDKRGIHYSRHKKRLLDEFDALTQINFNIERREPKGKDKDKAVKFSAPLLSITGKFEEWEVERGKPIETGKQVKENMQIFLHPEIYKYINSWYTVIPQTFLTIDARSRPHAILLYSYIANQWRIGLKTYRGVIKQTMRQFLDGAGLLNRLPKRANQQRNFIEKIKDDLKWLKSEPAYWIGDVKFKNKNILILEQTVIISMADEHPLKSTMKQIKEA